MGVIRVIDSYKVPAVDSNHEDTSNWQLQGSCSGLSSYCTCGGMACPCPWGLGALIWPASQLTYVVWPHCHWFQCCHLCTVLLVTWLVWMSSYVAHKFTKKKKYFCEYQHICLLVTVCLLEQNRNGQLSRSTARLGNPGLISVDLSCNKDIYISFSFLVFFLGSFDNFMHTSAHSLFLWLYYDDTSSCMPWHLQKFLKFL